MTRGESIDARAITSYRDRIHELRSALTRAEACNDSMHAALIRKEIDTLSHELAAATGLDGRPRRSASHSERARVSVTKAIKSALARISDHNADVGYHLSLSLSTGTFCCYRPHPSDPLDWDC